MIDKLRNKTTREIVTALRRDGFKLARQRGSRRTYSILSGIMGANSFLAFLS